VLLAAAIAALAPNPGAERPFVALSAEEREWLDTNRDHIVLAYDANYPPIEFQDKDGRLAGLAADIIAKVEKRLGVSFQKRPSRDWHAVLTSLESGEAHLEGGIVRTPERERFAYFTAPYIILPHAIITQKNAFTKGTLTWDGLKGRRVAVVSGYASETFLRERSQGNFEVVPVQNVAEGLHNVSFGVVDAFVENLATTSYYIETETLTNLRVAGTTDHTSPMSIAVSRKYPLLYSAVQKALAEIPREDIEAARKRWVALHGEGVLNPEAWRLIKLAALFSTLLLLGLAGISYILKRRLNEKVNSLKTAQQELLEQSERLAMATEGTNAGVWDFYPATGKAYFSDQWYTMLGYSPQFGARGLDSWSDLIHPCDRDRAVDSFATYIREGGRGMYEAEYRMRTNDGSWRWILGKGKAVAWDGAGRPTRIIGLNMDIHKSREAQEEMYRFQNLSKALLEQTTQFIGMLSLQGTLLSSNRTALEWVKAEAEDALGKPFWDGPWWPDKAKAEAMFREILDRVRAGETVRREIVHVDHEGNEAIFDFTASPFRDETGRVINLIVEGRDISELKKKQTAILESEKRFRTIFENAPYSMSINRLSDGKYMDANTAFLERMDISREELLRLTPLEVGALPEAHREEIFFALRRNQNVHNLETQVHRPNGTVGHILYSGGLITLDGESCILSMTVDITELKIAQEALRRSQEMFSRLFQLSPDIITLAKEEDGTLLEVNEAFSRITGHARDEAVGRTTLELGIFAVPSQREEFVRILKHSGHAENFEFDLRRSDGHVLRCSTSSKLMTIDGTPCILAITRDITHVRALQETMIQSEKMLSLGGIAAGIAHEINNPLGIVLQAVQTINLRTKVDFPKNLEAAAAIGVDLGQVDRYLKERKIDVFIRDIQGAAVRAAEIIRHMLDFSRRSESRHSVCDITTIIEHALRLASSDYDLKKNYDFKTIRIIKDFDKNLPAYECTETEIEQVLLNLLRNAAQAMADATPPTADPCISIRVRALGEGLRIEIADNGPGITQENRSRIFEPFFTTKATGAGTGLGLSVSYFIVTKGHRGKMWVASRPGQGTTFFIELPTEQPEADDA